MITPNFIAVALGYGSTRSLTREFGEQRNARTWRGMRAALDASWQTLNTFRPDREAAAEAWAMPPAAMARSMAPRPEGVPYEKRLYRQNLRSAHESISTGAIDRAPALCADPDSSMYIHAPAF